MRGNVPKINEKWSPLFRDNSKHYTRRQIVIIFDIGRTECGKSGVIYAERKVRRGRPKGSTQAANSSLPTIRSRSFEETQLCMSSCEIRVEYFVTFDGSSEQILRPEWYRSPKITIDVAGPLVLGTFTNVPCLLPAKVIY